MKTRCRGCRTLIEFGNTYCSDCEAKFKKAILQKELRKLISLQKHLYGNLLEKK